jgi:hypothetical protein
LNIFKKLDGNQEDNNDFTAEPNASFIEGFYHHRFPYQPFWLNKVAQLGITATKVE